MLLGEGLWARMRKRNYNREGQGVEGPGCGGARGGAIGGVGWG